MAEFVMVASLLTAVFVSVLQLAIVLHVRNTMMDAAAAGARHGTLADRSPAEGAERARSILRASLGPRFAQEVTYETPVIGDRPGVRVHASASVPLLGFLPGLGRLSVTAEAATYG